MRGRPRKGENDCKLCDLDMCKGNAWAAAKKEDVVKHCLVYTTTNLDSVPHMPAAGAPNAPTVSELSALRVMQAAVAKNPKVVLKGATIEVLRTAGGWRGWW